MLDVGSKSRRIRNGFVEKTNHVPSKIVEDESSSRITYRGVSPRSIHWTTFFAMLQPRHNRGNVWHFSLTNKDSLRITNIDSIMLATCNSFWREKDSVGVFPVPKESTLTFGRIAVTLRSTKRRETDRQFAVSSFVSIKGKSFSSHIKTFDRADEWSMSYLQSSRAHHHLETKNKALPLIE